MRKDISVTRVIIPTTTMTRQRRVTDPAKVKAQTKATAKAKEKHKEKEKENQKEKQKENNERGNYFQVSGHLLLLPPMYLHEGSYVLIPTA